MPFFQVLADTTGVQSSTRPDLVGNFSHIIVNKHPFTTVKEAIEAASTEQHYPNADIYAVEAETSREASKLFGQTDRSALRLIRKGGL